MKNTVFVKLNRAVLGDQYAHLMGSLDVLHAFGAG